jgi:RNA polymerase sigma factor (sigma-70 family)
MNELIIKDDGFEITAVTKLKHADLWAAAKKLGSQSALARHLGVKATTVGEWINLKRCPPAEAVGTHWTEDRITEIEGKLLALTGKTWDELFPDELRKSVQFLDCSKMIEKTARVRAESMEQYALATTERLSRGIEDTLQREEQREAVRSVLATLSYREREIIKMRFGIDQKCHTQEEVAKVFKVTKSRIHVLEHGALRKLQQPSRAHVLADVL